VVNIYNMIQIIVLNIVNLGSEHLIGREAKLLKVNLKEIDFGLQGGQKQFTNEMDGIVKYVENMVAIFMHITVCRFQNSLN